MTKKSNKKNKLSNLQKKGILKQIKDMNEKIKTIFIGTSKIGVPLLKSLNNNDNFDVQLVITQVDRPARRKMELLPPPIKIESTKLSLDIFQPESINDENSIKKIKNINPDVIILFAYGQILKKQILEIPKYGCLNVHGSILPKYRGASPVHAAILGMETKTGICLMKMEEEMDSGPVYKSFTYQIKNNENSLDITNKLADLASKKIPNAIIDVINNKVLPTEQKHSLATYCKKIYKLDGLINWNEDANIINAKIKAYYGWPSAFTYFNKKRLKIIEAKAINMVNKNEVGKIVRINKKILITTGNGSIVPIVVQIEGKKPQPITSFINGNPSFINSILTSTP